MFEYKQRVHLIANSKRLDTMTGLRIMTSGNLNVITTQCFHVYLNLLICGW